MHRRWSIGLAVLAFVVAAPSATGATLADSNQFPTHDVFLAGTNSGIYRSTDGGVSWRAASNGLPQAYVSALAVNPANASIIYAGTWNHGVYISRDGGLNWQDDNGGDLALANSAVSGLAIDPSHSPTVYAADDAGGIYKSGDGGMTWHFAAMHAGSVSKVIANPVRSSVLLAGANSYGVFKSIDHGRTWSKTNTSPLGIVYSLAFNPIDPDVAFAATSNGIYETIDGATTWQREQRGVHGVVDFRSVAVDPRNGANVIATSHGGDIYRSTDGGTSWTLRGNASGFPAYAIAFDPVRSGRVLVGDNYGIVLSEDHGATWKASTALHGQQINVLVPVMSSLRIP